MSGFRWTTAGLVVAALFGCAGEEEAGGKTYEFRPPWDAAGGAGDTEAPPEEVSEPGEVAEDTETDGSDTPVVPVDTSGLPRIACEDDALCQNLLAELTGPCASARCEGGLCALDAAADGAPCDDGVTCTTADQCAAGQCHGTDIVCDDGDDCTVDVCDPATGGCVSTELDGPGFTCDDGKACTEADSCTAGVCAGTPKSCDDGEGCTTDTCVTATGDCKNDAAPNQNQSCNDHSACTSGETCKDGTCRGVENDCDDGKPCTADWCLPTTGACTHGASAAIDGLACDDGEACTVDDVCLFGECAGLPKPCPAGTCLVSACAGGVCSPAEPAADGTACEDGTICTSAEACDGGACVGGVVFCDDGSPCTADLCDPEEGCGSTPLGDGAPCDDGDACTGGDLCAGLGCAGTAPDCDDYNPCSADGCAPASGDCTHDAAAMNGASCAVDADRCTSGGACEAGQCLGEGPTACSDGNACTDDACNPETGDCDATPKAAETPCQDGAVCTQGDHCQGPTCAGTARTCDDGNECTNDSCAEATGCVHATVSGCQKPLHPCNASGAKTTTNPTVTQCVCAFEPTCCTLGWGESCVAIAESTCGITCATCDSAVACKIDADCGFCDPDSDACTGGWRCDAGACRATDPVVCDGASDVGCLHTQCNKDNGECTRAPREALCDDGLACTIDLCGGDGTCTRAPRPSCGEQHPCEVSSAPASVDPATTACVCAAEPACCTGSWSAACVSLARESCGLVCDCAALPSSATVCQADADCTKCDDEALCNGGWRCDAGRCTATGAVDCSPRGCLTGECDPETGTCSMTPDPAHCDDGDGCTTDTCLPSNGACAHHPVPGCGLQPPCTTSTLAHSSDSAIDACVCEQRPECCASAWTPDCVLTAHFACGALCGCVAEPQACTTEADCATCEDTNQCNGAWVCAGGLCTQAPGVDCDPAEDEGCRRSTCQPATGTCSLVNIHTACDDGLPCTLDLCEGGAGDCIHAPNLACGTNHPCSPSALPESSDPEVTACVCALDLACCTGAWSDACVSLAMTACGLECNCAALPPSATSCEDDTDCWVCNESPCTGSWTCQTGQCVTTGAVTCSQASDRGCVQNRCSPTTGVCELTAQNEACPSVGCLGGVCDYTAGTCGSERIPGCVASADLCEPSPLPGTEGDDVARCVCGFDAFCCNGGWDQLCADQAVQLCGLKCGCDRKTPAQLACGADADCDGCDADGDACNGTWRCQDQRCTAVPKVQCNGAGGGCNAESCDPSTGQCAPGGDPNACDDGNACTADACSPSTSQCSHAPIAGCGTNSPCTAATTPGSKNPGVTSCVCVLAPECCLEAWSAACAGLATTECGFVCETCPPGGCVGSLEPICPTTGCTGTETSALLCALDVCFAGLGVEAGLSVASPTDSTLDGAYGALPHYGTLDNDLAPRSGESYFMLATGTLDARPHASELGGEAVLDPWTKAEHPASLRDVVEATLSLKAPAGVTGFSLDTRFLSVEFPEFVGSEYIDAFYVILQAPVTTSGQPVIVNAGPCAAPDVYTDYLESGAPRCYTGINSAFAQPCDGTGSNLTGTGFECGGPQAEGGSATGWLRTSWPIQPGESFTLRFHIHDSVDVGYDSAAIIDRFRWLTAPAVVSGTVPAP